MQSIVSKVFIRYAPPPPRDAMSRRGIDELKIRVEAIFFPPSFHGCCSFAFIILDSRFEILFCSTFYYPPFLSILCESGGIIIVQSYPSSFIHWPPLLEKCFLHFPSRFYTRPHRWMYEFNNGTVKLLLCLRRVYFVECLNLSFSFLFFFSYYITCSCFHQEIEECSNTIILLYITRKLSYHIAL